MKFAFLPCALISALGFFLYAAHRESTPDGEGAPEPGVPVVAGYSRFERYQTATKLLGTIVPEFRALHRNHGALRALAPSSNASDLDGRIAELALIGNFRGYLEPCHCSTQASTGGMASIAGVLGYWGEGASATRAIVAVGESILPHEITDPKLRDIYRRRGRLLADAYRQTGVAVFCPSALDIRGLGGLDQVRKWCRAAGVQCVISNAQSEDSGSAWHLPWHDASSVSVVSVIEPGLLAGDSGLKPPLESLAQVGRFLRSDNCALIVVLHGVDPRAAARAIPAEYRDRAFYVVGDERLNADDLQDVGGDDRLIRMVPRGQAVEFLQLLRRDGARGRVKNAEPKALLLELHRRIGRPLANRALDARASSEDMYTRVTLPLSEALEARIQKNDEVEALVRQYDAELLAVLLKDEPFTRATLPGKYSLADAATCAACHERQATAWRDAGPHSHAVGTVLASQDRPPSVTCFKCHLTGFRRETLDTAVAGSRGGLRLRDVVGGVSCVSCHSDVRESHVLNPDSTRRPNVARARANCTRCHDGVNSPRFEVHEYATRLGCYVARRVAVGPDGHRDRKELR